MCVGLELLAEHSRECVKLISCVHAAVLDATKSKEVLGLKYKSLKDTLVDMSLSLAEQKFQ